MQTWTSPHGRTLPPIGKKTLIMGVLNATPDSFSDGGQLASPASAVARATDLIQAGADLLDLGGESTRPGAVPISIDEELSRILPILTALREAFPACPISIDSYKAAVADAAIEHGADIINDVWGLTHGISGDELATWQDAAIRSADSSKTASPMSSSMAEVAARRGCPVVIMHNRRNRNYTGFWEDVLADLKTSLLIARAANISDRQIWLDPGFGFAKNIQQNLEVLRDLHRVVELGYPVLVGTSRKSTIGAVLGTSVDHRLEGGGATVVWAIQQGCQMIRVHDVREMARFARMADAIKAGLDFVTA
jgi:dihydropteroate synthase